MSPAIALALLTQTVPASVPPPQIIIQEPGPVYFTEGIEFLPSTLPTLAYLIEQARQPTVVAVTITAHTDTAGSSSYNQRLSEARARVIADRMIAAGIDPGLITVVGMGETALARPTADDTVERLNRRATIDIRYRSPS